MTGPNLSFEVGVVSQFMQNPCIGHWNVAIRILRYLIKTVGQGLLYEDKGNTQIFVYCDTNWAGSPTDRRSTIGYCVLLGENVIKKQNVA